MHLLVYEYCCVQSASDPAGLALLHEGWGMLRAVVEDLSRAGHHLTVLANPALADRLCTFPQVTIVPTLPNNDRDQLAHWAARVDACLIIAPEFRRLLTERVQLVREVGGFSLNCTPECIERVTNKLTLVDHFRRGEWNSVSFPPTVRWDPGTVWEHRSFPLVIKPIDGAGSQATYLVRTSGELERAAFEAREAGWPDLIVQTYWEGVSASVCRLAGSQPILCPATEQLLSSDGRFHYLGAQYPLPADLQERAWALIRELNSTNCPGLLGWVGADICLATVPSSQQSADVFLDINPRLTTSYLALRRRCHDNLADAMVRVATGETVCSLRWDGTPLEFRVE